MALNKKPLPQKDMRDLYQKMKQVHYMLVLILGTIIFLSIVGPIYLR